MGEIVSIISGKGGVGKTTVALNLASAFNKKGYNTLVFDGNVTSPTGALYLGYLPAEKTINNVLKGELELGGAILTHDSGVKLLTCSLGLADLKSDYRRAFGLLRELKRNYDIIFIDAGAGLDEEAQMAIEASDYVIVVTNPELPATIDALRAVRLARAFNKKVLGVIVNKVNYGRPQLPVAEVGSIAEAPVIGSVVEDDAVQEAFAYNQPVVHMRPYARASADFMNIAAKILGEKESHKSRVLIDRISFWLHKIGLKYLP
ncbi:MAG: AAA family ATPase [Candidatus Diapherotrites archaeon]